MQKRSHELSRPGEGTCQGCIRVEGRGQIVTLGQFGNESLYQLMGSRYVQGVPSARGLGWVDLNFECSTVRRILPGLMVIWQKRLRKVGEHPNQRQPKPGPRADGTLCINCY